jgi:cell division protein FtsB
MAITGSLKRLARWAAAPLAFSAVTAYFAWNLTRGDHGLIAYAQRQALLRQAAAERDAAQTEHDMWERRVAGLRASHLDPDTLDERARAMLNLADPSEVIVPYPGKDRLF